MSKSREHLTARSAPLIALALLLASCAKPSGSVYGDVYFEGADGEGKRASNVTVRLLRGADSLDAAMGPVCRQHLDASLALKSRLVESLNLATSGKGGRDVLQQAVTHAPVAMARNDSVRALAKQTIDGVNDIIDRLTVDSIVTGLEARYRFSRQPGEYALVARGSFGTGIHVWVARATIPRDDSAKVDLGIRQDRGFDFYCSLPPGDLASTAVFNEEDVAKAKTQLQQIDAANAANDRARAAAAREQAAIDKAYADSVAKAEEESRQERAYLQSDAAARARAVDIGRVDVRPKMISGEAADGNLRSVPGVRNGGFVMVRYVVESDGSVAAIVVEDASSALLRPAAIRAIESRKYEPGTIAGRPVAVRMRQSLQVP